MNAKIPQPIISILSDNLPPMESHASLDSLFMYADAPGDPPEGSKPAKVQKWLGRINDESSAPLVILGRLIENYMDMVVNEPDEFDHVLPMGRTQRIIYLRQKLITQLEKSNLIYVSGGIIHDGKSASSEQLWSIVKTRNIPCIEEEFKRALSKINSEPREAVSAACNILESVFKVYIQDEGLELPQKQDIQGLWKVVVGRLGFDPKCIEDDDLKKFYQVCFQL